MSIDKSFPLSACPDEALSDWERFCTACKLQKIKPPKAEPFLKIFGNSRFLARFAIKHPNLALEAIESPFLVSLKPLSDFSDELDRIPSPDLDSWLKKVRQYKYRELLRITAKDYGGAADEDILSELSALAEGILKAVDRRIYAEAEAKYGKPLLNSGEPCRYTILGLGKLGGRELNFSSDIDLIAITESDEGKAGALSLHEFFVRHVQNLTGALQSETGDGFLYRVDWDLRPEGKAGTLVNSMAAMESYYESFGADWERQALTKCRPVAGNPSLGEKFVRIISPFVYRKYLDLDTLRQIQSMKRKIHAELDKKPSRGFNVKLGIGGIREIEFFVQVFLLIYGGRKPEIRHTGTLKALKNLEEAGLVNRDEASLLRNGYLFLRRLEHRLQLVDERQTHWLSDDPAEQLRTARRMGFDGTSAESALKDFRSQIDEATSSVRRIFDSLFSETAPVQTVSESPAGLKHEDILNEYRRALEDRLAQWPKVEDWLDEIRYFKKDEIKKIIELENSGKTSRREILCRISLVAEAICQEALKIAIRELAPRFGTPSFKRNDGKAGEADLMTVGMGKLGGREINYGSDLDVIFIFSEQGETTGGTEIISNGEYFARLVQKFISIIALTTRGGRAYAIDTELRPSGHQGPLVTTLSGFIDYQRNTSQIWERQSLLRARPIAGAPHFARLVRGHIDALLTSQSFPPDIQSEMHRLRTRVEKEIARESDRVIDYKGGKGGIMDIEFFLQYHQLCFGRDHPGLRTANTFDGLDKLKGTNLVPAASIESLLKAYNFYRDVESKIHLRKNRSTHRLDLGDPLFDDLATDLGLKGSKEFLEKYFAYREKVRKIYGDIFLTNG
ncbi:MAG: hypothetical protein HY541_00445 [Deltaproteobacteria bacterium]|nr:hypothetical protein [Deltaproteobacteria bacterium]